MLADPSTPLTLGIVFILNLVGNQCASFDRDGKLRQLYESVDVVVVRVFALMNSPQSGSGHGPQLSLTAVCRSSTPATPLGSPLFRSIPTTAVRACLPACGSTSTASTSPPLPLSVRYDMAVVSVATPSLNPFFFDQQTPRLSFVDPYSTITYGVSTSPFRTPLTGPGKPANMNFAQRLENTIVYLFGVYSRCASIYSRDVAFARRCCAALRLNIIVCLLHYSFYVVEPKLSEVAEQLGYGPLKLYDTFDTVRKGGPRNPIRAHPELFLPIFSTMARTNITSTTPFFFLLFAFPFQG